jgi:hypothetical protein
LLRGEASKKGFPLVHQKYRQKKSELMIGKQKELKYFNRENPS